MSRKRPADGEPITEPPAKRGPILTSSHRPATLEGSLLLPAAANRNVAASSNASGGAIRLAPGAPPQEGSMRVKTEGAASERSLPLKTVGAGARTVAARMMGNAHPGGAPEDSSGSATVTHGGGVCRGPPSDEDEQNFSEEEIDGGDVGGGAPVAVELTPEELARRRARRMTRLLKLYRVQYWGLCEEMRAKHRRFFLRQGTSGWKAEGDGAAASDPGAAAASNGPAAAAQSAAAGAADAPTPPPCSEEECTERVMPASAFCFRHILSDPLQQLYCACTHSSSPDGSDPCARPVLRVVVPALCAQHAALRKVAPSPRPRPTSAGSSAGGATSSSSKLPVPPVHILMNEYVKTLQRHRQVMATMKHVQTLQT